MYAYTFFKIPKIKLSTNDVPEEYMGCFNIFDEIPEVTAMEEVVQTDLYETTALEWHEWHPVQVEKKLSQI